MTNLRPLYVVDQATLTGPSRQKRWRMCFSAGSRRQCHLYVDRILSQIVAADPLQSLLEQERARDYFRIRGIRRGF